MNEVCGNPTCNQTCGEEPRVCPRCKAVPYCSRGCQKADYKVHKKICGSLNAGKAAQLQHPDHVQDKMGGGILQKLIAAQASFSAPSQELYRLFMTSSKKDADLDQTVAKIKQLASKISAHEKEAVMFHSVHILLRTKTSKLLLPTSPFTILLQEGVNPSALSRPDSLNPQSRPNDDSRTPLHIISEASEANNEMVLQNQVVLGKQLLEAGADVNAKAGSNWGSDSPLYDACASQNVSNLDYIRLLLDFGADPNQQNIWGQTPLMCTMEMSMPAAKLLLTYDYDQEPRAIPINVNVETHSGSTMLGGIRLGLKKVKRQREFAALGFPPMSDKGWTTPEPYDYLISQMEEVEQLLIDKSAIDHGWNESNPVPPQQGEAAAAPKAPLDFDVEALLDKDLTSNAPSWYLGLVFFSQDATARQFEASEKVDYLSSGRGQGSQCGRKPALGQKLNIRVPLPGESWGRLVGEITELYSIPTDRELGKSGSFLYGKACRCGNPRCEFTRTGKRPEILSRFGAVHGQKVKGLVSLGAAYHSDNVLTTFFRGANTQYEVVLQCNDHKQNMWEVVRISLHDKSDKKKNRNDSSDLCACGCGKTAPCKCGRCKKVSYYSRECQQKHWKLHKHECKKLGD